jgi:hypothetical protein
MLDSGYSVVRRGSDERAWAQVYQQTNAEGMVTTTTNSVIVEVANGLHYQGDGVRKQMKTLLGKAVLLAAAVSLGMTSLGHAQSFLTNGLVAYYPFNGNGRDESGNGHDALSVTANPTTDRFGLADGAMQFNPYRGSNVVVLPRIPALDFSHDFTVSIWVYLDPVYSLTHSLLSCGTNTYSVALRITPCYSPCDFQDSWLSFVWGEPPPKTLSTFVSLSSPAWRHVAVVRSGNDVSLFWNGSALTNGVMDTAPDWEEMWLGMSQGGDLPLDGMLDEVRFYNVALSTSEVKQLYDFEGTPFFGVKKFSHLVQSDLLVGTNYQLQASTNLEVWTDLDPPFVAVSSTTNTFYPLGEPPIFFRMTSTAELGNNQSPKITAIKAAELSFFHLSVGTNYQLQSSKDMTTWINHGAVFTAETTSLVYPEYVDVNFWGGTPFFRLRASP